MLSFNEQMAKYTTITTLDFDVMLTLWQAMSDYTIDVIRENQLEDDWHANACDFVPIIINELAMLFGHTTEGPVCTLEQLRIHVAHISLGIDIYPWSVLGRLFDTYDDINACYVANEHMYGDAWYATPNPYHIDTNALPTT